jgi:hypothetical protein
MSPEARLVCGLSLLLVPTIIYGGLTVLGVVSGGQYGAPAPLDLSPLQVTLYRAMHAHAGVLTLLGLFVQIALDHVALLCPRSGPFVCQRSLRRCSSLQDSSAWRTSRRCACCSISGQSCLSRRRSWSGSASSEPEPRLRDQLQMSAAG